MHSVFISHSSEDKAVANDICSLLEANGITCWIAPRDEKAGIKYSGQLTDAVQGSKILVVIVSGQSNKSEHVLREVALALEVGVIVIPFKIDEIAIPKAYAYYLNNIHGINAFPKPSHYFETLLNDILYLMEYNILNKELSPLYTNSYNRDKLIEETRDERLSFGRSIDVDRKYNVIDDKHLYKRIKRIDIVEGENQISYRWLHIKNISDIPTNMIVHKEAGECKIKFGSMGVRAYVDDNNGVRLEVGSKTIVQPSFEQIFEIYFDKLLNPGEEKHIFYRLKWPGEALAYDDYNRSQSISLTRYIAGVDELLFGLYEFTPIVKMQLIGINRQYKQKDLAIAPRRLSIVEDADLMPIHAKKINGIYYHICPSDDASYRIIYKLGIKHENAEDEDDF